MSHKEPSHILLINIIQLFSQLSLNLLLYDSNYCKYHSIILQDLSTDTMLTAANGRHYPALKIFTFAMSYLRDHVIRELSDQSGVKILNEDIRWVVCVPAIWKAPAKQFMRQAAYKVRTTIIHCIEVVLKLYTYRKDLLHRVKVLV